MGDFDFEPDEDSSIQQQPPTPLAAPEGGLSSIDGSASYLPSGDVQEDYTGSSQGGAPVGGGGGYADLDAMLPAGDDDDGPEQSPSALDAFLAQWELKLQEKRQYEAEKKAEVVQKAQGELSKFQEERELLREKKQSINRKDEQVKVEKLVADLELDNPWERVVNLVDMQAEAAKVDLSRMKQIFIQLKNQPDPSSLSTSKTKA